PHDHAPLSVDAYTPESHRSCLQEDSAGAAEGVEDGAGHRNPGEVHECTRKLRMERNREGERSVRDLGGFQPRPIHAMQHPAEDELLVEKNTIVDLRRIEIHVARLP